MSRGYAMGSAILCRYPLFRDFIAETSGRPVADAEAAAKELRLACDVMSRRELDGDPEAGARYLALLERFNEWLR